MAISSPGLGSNLDVNSIISQLMSLEQRPLTALAERKRFSRPRSRPSVHCRAPFRRCRPQPLPGPGHRQRAHWRSSRFSEYAQRYPRSPRRATTSSAVAGTYSLEVNQLARQHASPAAPVPPVRLTAPARATAGGGGTLTSRSTATAAAARTRATNDHHCRRRDAGAIRDAINTASAGVSATVINGVAGKQLVLTSDKPGQQPVHQALRRGRPCLRPERGAGCRRSFRAVAGGAGFAFKLNGIAVEASSNTVSTAIDGITLTCSRVQSAAGDGYEHDADRSARDTSSLTAGVNALSRPSTTFSTTASTSAATMRQPSRPAHSTATAPAHGAGHRPLALGNIPSEVAGASLQRLSDIGVSCRRTASWRSIPAS
jgi:flagellar hook-associated protein 2